MSRQHAFGAPAVDAGNRNVVLYMQGDHQFSPSWFFEDITDPQTQNVATVLRVKDMPVFRSGSFKDSLGDLTTWETLHIDQMAATFTFLKDQQVFADVPVREGHGSFFGDPMTGLVGYHDALRTQDAKAPDGNTYRYLLADFTIYDPQNQQAFLSGKWRNRSSEVGYYETNDGTGYYPVYQGFAFVDIPAVNYLNLFSKEKQRSFSVLLERDIKMDPDEQPNGGTTTEPDGSPAPQNEPVGTPAAPNTEGNGNTEPNESQENDGQQGTPQNEPVTPPAPTPVPPAANGDHSAPTAPHVFNCGGNQTSDFAAVQNYISGLETEVNGLRTFRTETLTAGRKNFVSQLAKDKKILGSQVEGMTAHALSLTDEQFSAFTAMYKDSPVLPLFGEHGGSSGSPENVEDLTKDEREFKQVEQQVNWHRMSGMREDDVAQTLSYKRYVELGKALGKEVS